MAPNFPCAFPDPQGTPDPANGPPAPADAPATPVGDGRDDRGRFAAGNGYGRGNPLNAQVQRARAIVHEAVGPDELRRVFAALVARATGDGPDAVAAAKVLLGYAIGRPAPAPDPSGEVQTGIRFIVKAIDREAAESV
jgi:hypothetical protein